jgi:hypothetical protein
MGPSGRLRKALELSEMTKRLFKEGLRRRFPEKSDAEIHKLFLERLMRCQNHNF